MADPVVHHALGDVAARTLANATKTVPQMSSITPRWLIHFLQWVPVEAGIYRRNRVLDPSRVAVECSDRDERRLPETFVGYEESPREYMLTAVHTVLEVHTRVSDLYSSPYSQIGEQLRLTIETIKEQQESELINNTEYGMLHNAAPSMRISTRAGEPTPDDLDELIARVWKEPAFFLAHPAAIAAFGRECTYRGVPPATLALFGSPFITWRGIPLIPCDKLKIADGKTNILLLRTGEAKQGVVGLYQPNLPGEQGMGLSVRFMAINHQAIASYLIALYCSLAVLTDDALGVLENVHVDKYIMSTIEAGRPVLPSQTAELPGRDVAAAFDTASSASHSLPDPQVLTRLANEMFSALSGAGPVVSGVPRPAAEAIAEPAQSLGAVVPSADTVAHGTPAPRPPFAVASLPVTSPPTSPSPREAELRALLTPLAAPRRPAAVESPSFGSSGASFYFLDGVQPSSPWGRFPGTHSLGVPPRTESAAHPPFDVDAIRRDFPILGERVRGRPLIWLDNAATTQKPRAVIDRLAHFYLHENSNIHRGAHELAARATDAYEAARESVRRFLNASSADEIVFLRGATEAINLVAQSWGRQNIGRDDEIVITWLEHHANIVPWQQLCSEKGARLRVVPVDAHGQVLLDAYEKLLGPGTRLVAFPHVSNALGTVTPARQMVEMARRHGAHVLIDGAQAVSHMRADVQSLDCDWYVLSGHKVFAPTGIGALYGKRQVLEAMPPWQGGGNMIECVTFEKTEYQAAHARFEAGTGSIADAVGLGAAIDYLDRIGIENVNRYEHELLVYATRLLSGVPGLRLIGTAPEKAVVLSFVLDGFRSEDVGAALDREGIAVRAGHHCAQPILRRFGLESTVRPSLALYNTFADIEALVAALHRIRSGSPLIG